MSTIADDHHIYDVVIVGAGMTGGILAKQLIKAGHSVAILESGAKHGEKWETYRDYLDQFYLSLAKTPNSPYPDLSTSPSPSVLDITAVRGTTPDTEGYFVQQGPMPFGSNYLRAYGGTTLHWLGTSLRMLPADFEMASRFGRGVDWPIKYQALRPYYELAEWEIGVSGEVAEQTPHAMGIQTSNPKDNDGYFAKDYEYPMHKIPSSYMDDYVAERADGLPVDMGTQRHYQGHRGKGSDIVAAKVSNTPVGRNSTPRHPGRGKNGFKVAGKERAAFQPRGATGAFSFMGQRCEGNSSCIPICPIQAKYNAMKTLDDALTEAKQRDIKLHIKEQSVASRVELDENLRIKGIVYKRYDFPGVPQYSMRRIRGKQYVLAGGAVENVTLALASGLCPSSHELGRNLMDHPYMMTWGLAQDPVGAFRGPGSTSGIASYRDGVFRDQKAAFRLELGNWGWNFAAGSPTSNVMQLVENENLFGAELRRKLYHDVQRQIRIGVLVEQLPQSSNRVTIDPSYRDAMGEYRPVISYDIGDYSRAGLALAHDACMQIYRQAGIKNHTHYNPSDAGYMTYDGKGLTVFGAGHLVGTHRMGTSADKKGSVTDENMRTWDHSNLWMVGCGSMPTIATSNPTLTMAALAFKAGDAIKGALK